MADRDIFRVFGTGTSFWFQAKTGAAGAVYAGGFVAGECKLRQNNAAQVNTTNLPTYIGQGLYNIVLTSAEMAFEFIQFTAVNAGALPIHVSIQTNFQVGSAKIDATYYTVQTIGIEVKGGANGGAGATFTGGAAGGQGIKCVGNEASSAFDCQATGVGHGIVGTGSTGGSGIFARGGTSSGNGFSASAGVGSNAHGMIAQGDGTGAGSVHSGGAAGVGIRGLAGGGSVPGMELIGQGGGGGLYARGGAIGSGIEAIGGATSGTGIYASGPGGNSHGIYASGSGNGSGIVGLSIGTGNGIYALGGLTSGAGFVASAQGGNSSGIVASGVGIGLGLNVSGASFSYYHNLFEQSELTEPVAGAVPTTASYRQMLQFLKRRWSNKHMVAAGSLKVMKDDSVTTMTSQTVSSDGLTIGKTT